MSHSSTATQRPSIVVINSEPTFLHVVGILLEDEGFRAITTHISDASFDVIRAAEPVIVVVDFVHGKTDAWELLDLLDADERTALIPLLATSTDETMLVRVQERAHQRPQVEVLIKPMELDAFLEALHSLCNGGTPVT